MTRFLHRFIPAILIATLAACQPSGLATEYLLFLDQSGSVSAAQRDAWLATAESAMKRLSFGDSVAIFPIHDHTLEAAPLFRAHVPDKGQSLEDLVKAKKMLGQVRQHAAAVLRDALSGTTRAPATQLFEVVDKLASAPRGERQVSRRVFVFSDFLQSSGDTDFGRTQLTDHSMAALVSRLPSRHGWTNDTLRGVTVYGILNGVSSGGAQPANDRRVLKKFWGTLFRELGAELASFDTYLELE